MDSEPFSNSLMNNLFCGGKTVSFIETKSHFDFRTLSQQQEFETTLQLDQFYCSNKKSEKRHIFKV